MGAADTSRAPLAKTGLGYWVNSIPVANNGASAAGYEEKAAEALGDGVDAMAVVKGTVEYGVVVEVVDVEVDVVGVGVVIEWGNGS